MVSTDSLAVRLVYDGRTANVTLYIPNDLRDKVNIFGDDNIDSSEERNPHEHVSNSECLPS